MEPGQGRGVWVLGSVFLIPFVLFGCGVISTVPFIAAIIFAVYLALLVVNFEIGFLTLIFLRSSIDYLRHFSGGEAVNLAAVVSLALIVLGIFYVLFTKANIFDYEDSAPFLVFIAFCGISVLYSPDRMASISDWLRLVSVYSVYILTRIIFRTKRKIQRLLIVVSLSALIPIAVAYQQLFFGGSGEGRIMGTFLHPNAFASYLLILLIFWTAQILENSHFIKRRFLIALALAALVIFIFTFSRGAWIVFILAMFVMGILRYKKILGLLPAILLVTILTVPAVKDRIVNIFEPGYTHGRSGWDWRVETWAEISDMVKAKPLLGHGLAAVEIEFGILTHNDYLRLVAEIGILGLLAYLVFAGRLLQISWRDFNQIKAPIAASFQVGLVAMVAGFLVREFADNTLRNTVMMIYFWIFVAISRNMAELYGNQKSTDRQ